MSSETESDSDEETAKILNQNFTASSAASTAKILNQNSTASSIPNQQAYGTSTSMRESRTFLRTCAGLPTRALQIVSGAANAVSSVKINATVVIEAEIEDTCAVSKFFLDPDNKAFTSADGNAWWFERNFNQNQVVFEGSFDTVSRTWSRLLQGPFKHEIKDPKLDDVQYVKVGEFALGLFALGGPGFTPVATILGMQKVWNHRRSMLQSAQKEPISAGASIAASRMQVLGMRVHYVLLHLLSSPRNCLSRI